jgi:hypothetical protein
MHVGSCERDAVVEGTADAVEPRGAGADATRIDPFGDVRFLRRQMQLVASATIFR